VAAFWPEVFDVAELLMTELGLAEGTFAVLRRQECLLDLLVCVNVRVGLGEVCAAVVLLARLFRGFAAPGAKDLRRLAAPDDADHRPDCLRFFNNSNVSRRS